MVAGGYDGERIGCASRQSDCDIKATQCRFPIQFQSSCLATWPESITLSLPAYGRSSFTGLSPVPRGFFSELLRRLPNSSSIAGFGNYQIAAAKTKQISIVVSSHPMANKYLAKVIAQARIWAGCSIASNRFAF
jgi:hypothetical protein